jgi:multisubunit Na+/H+ antiporter MnhG subunit
VHELIITVVVVITAPVTFMLLVRAALHRDHPEDDETSTPVS